MSATDTQTQAIPTGTWTADTVHSSVGFEVPYAVAIFSGDVHEFEASLEDGTIKGTAKIASLQTKDENLQAHLLSPEFFDAERNPEVSFSGSEIKRDGDNVEIPGEITIKGISQPATLKGTITGPAIDHFGKNRVGLKLETTIDRTKHDITWSMPLPDGDQALANDVTLKADLTLVSSEA